MDSPPHEGRQHTPTSQSRTRNTQAAQRDKLEKLKAKLTYEEEMLDVSSLYLLNPTMQNIEMTSTLFISGYWHTATVNRLVHLG